MGLTLNLIPSTTRTRLATEKKSSGISNTRIEQSGMSKSKRVPPKAQINPPTRASSFASP
eukprot:6210404-Pleurochrysis_carterae.AAC.1